MRLIKAILFLVLALNVSAAEYITATFTITNAPVHGNTITINGSTRAWTNSVSIPASQILINAAVGGSATNLFNCYGVTPAVGVIVTRVGTNGVKFQGTGLTASQVGTWASLVLSTNSSGSGLNWTVPLANVVESNRIYIASQGTLDINQYSTNAINQTNLIASELIGLTNTQTASGLKTWTGTQTALNSSNVYAGTFTNGFVYANGGSVSNVSMFNAAIYSGSISGVIGLTTNGILHNASLDGATLYGSAILLGDFAFANDNTGNTLTMKDNGEMGFYSSIFDELVLYVDTNGYANVQTLFAEDAINIGPNTEGFYSRLYQVGNGVLGINNPITVKGAIDVTQGVNTSLANGNNAAVDISTNGYVKVSGPTAAFNINGIANGRDGRKLTIQNSTGYAVTIANDSGVDPVAANRIYTGTGADVTITNDPATIDFHYDPSVSRWILENIPGGSVAGVTSVALTAPAEFSVSGSPVTGSGTLAVTKATQSANTFWRGPTSGGAAQPSFGQIVTADIGSDDLGSGTANSTTYLRGDRTWQTISGGGNNFTSTFYTNGSSQIALNNTNLVTVGITNYGDITISDGSLSMTNTGTSVSMAVSAEGSVDVMIWDGDFNLDFNNGLGVHFGTTGNLELEGFDALNFTSEETYIGGITPLAYIRSRVFQLEDINGFGEPPAPAIHGNAADEVIITGDVVMTNTAAGRPSTINGVKVYRALVTQSGTNAPTATVLENSLGGAGTWARTTTGTYTFTLSSTFTADKTFLRNHVASFDDGGSMLSLNRNDANTISASYLFEGVSADGFINLPFEILVYP